MMKKVSIKNLNDKIDIIVNNTKYVCGNDYEAKDKIKKVLINTFNRVSASEYGENNNKTELLIDDEPISLNDYMFFYIDTNFDLNQDIKLGTKSISLEYINSLFDNIEYSDEYQTINNLLIDFLENIIEENDNLIKPNIECILTKKLLIKMIELKILYDDYIVNNYDLTLEEKILLQLRMVKQIFLKTTKKILLLVDCPIISKTIKNTIENLNVMSIILFEKIAREYIPDLLILDDIRIDTLDENAIFELCNSNKNAYLNITTMKEKLMEDYLFTRFI